MKGSRDRRWLLQFVLFGLVGALNTAVDFGIFALLTWLSVHYSAAQALSYFAGMVNSYLLNNGITFRSARSAGKEGLTASLRRQVRFLIWNGTMLLLSVALISGAVQLLEWSAWLAKIIVTILILGLNFYGSKKWVFNSARSVESAKMGD